MNFGFSSRLIISDISIAPTGMATPSDQQSIKSSMQSFHMADAFQRKIPVEPRPSTATSSASIKIRPDTISVTFVRSTCLPFFAALSIANAPTTSISEMADEMAAMMTSR